MPLLHRTRAYALIELGRLDEARLALDASLEAATARISEHEVALTQRALAELDRLEGKIPEAGAEANSRRVLKRLGVVRVPPLPLPERVAEAAALH